MQYIYPDLPEDSPVARGGLPDRLENAHRLGCEWAEVPAGLIRGPAEAELTGLGEGAIPDEGAIASLYAAGDADAAAGRYVLDTHPPAPEGVPGEHPMPRWADRQWVNRFAEMALLIATRLGSAPFAVEIHPGELGTSIGDLVVSARTIHDRLEKNLGVEPRILLANSTGASIQAGREVAALWQAVRTKPGVPAWLGIELDVRQLVGAGPSFAAELDAVPDEAVRALRLPGNRVVEGDEIPWPTVFSRRFMLPRGLIIHPGGRSRSEVEAAIRFCEEQAALHRDRARTGE